MKKNIFVVSKITSNEETGLLGAFSNRGKAWKCVEKELGEDDIYYDYHKSRVGRYTSLCQRLIISKSVQLENPYGERVEIRKCILNGE